MLNINWGDDHAIAPTNVPDEFKGAVESNDIENLLKEAEKEFNENQNRESTMHEYLWKRMESFLVVYL